jgi:hypothetical protein
MRALPHHSSRQGGAMILALLFMGVVTMGFATWAILIRQRARVSDLEEHQVRKRLAAANTEVLYRDYLLRRTLASNGDDDGLSTNTAGISTWNTATATSWDGLAYNWTAAWTNYPMSVSTRLAGLNGFSPSYDYPYSKAYNFWSSYKKLIYKDINDATAPGTEQYLDDATSYRGYVRSRNLLLGGDLLVLHRPTVSGGALPAVTGNVAVNGRVVHFAPDIATGNYTARSIRFTAPPVNPASVPTVINVAPADIAGAALAWSNLPWTPLSSGAVSGSNLESIASGDDWRFPDFTGQLNFIDSSATNASNSLRAKIITGSHLQPAGTAAYSEPRGLNLNGAGTATITPCLGSTVSDLPSVVLSNTNGLTEIIIEGQTGANFSGYAPLRPAMGIVYTQSNTGTNLTTIRLRNQNNRRLLLALKKDFRAAAMLPVNVIIETTGTSADWHLLILAENVPLTFTTVTVNTFNLYGGIQTNSPLVFPPSPKLFQINLETDTRGLLRMSPRLAWVETFLSGKL